MVIRLIILALVGGGAWYLSASWQRRRGPGLHFSPGVTLVTGAGCSLCGRVEHALRRAGIAPMVRDIATVDGLAIRSIPTVIVADESGAVVVRRSGRMALDDVGIIAAHAGKSTGGTPGR